MLSVFERIFRKGRMEDWTKRQDFTSHPGQLRRAETAPESTSAVSWSWQSVILCLHFLNIENGGF